MRNFKSNTKNTDVAGLLFKVCAWILSIMLIVTGIAPSFANNAKAGNGVADFKGNATICEKKSFDSKEKADATKLQTITNKQAILLKNQAATGVQNATYNGYSSYYRNLRKGSSNSNKPKLKINSNTSLKSKVAVKIKKRVRLSKSRKSKELKKISDFSKNKDGDGKKRKFNKKGDKAFNLNSSGNVKATINNEGNMIISVGDSAGDRNIERAQWIDMVKELGGKELDWQGSSLNGNIQVVDEVNLPENSSNLFYGIKGNLIGADKLNTSKVTNMYAMFKLARSANPDVSNWDVSKVFHMGKMFDGAASANPDVSKWNISNVKYMSFMFFFASSANPDVSKWDTSAVKSMGSMFEGATSANPDVSKWDTAGVENMDSMFKEATSANPDVSNWETLKLTNITNIFYKASSANPDVSKWNTSGVTDMYGVFRYSAIRKADISKWNIRRDVSSSNMFCGCKNLEYLKTANGLKTAAYEINKDFKVVKLKKGSEAIVEKESINLNSYFTINAGGDKDTSYHIYCKDKYAGVAFDKNGADTSMFRNHEIVDKGKSIKDAKGELPEVKPKRTGYKFLGWAKSHKATASDFDEDTIVRDDIVVYAVWREIVFPLNSKGDVKAKVGRDGDITISVVNSDGDRNIERRKWIDMVKETGGEDLDWKRSSFTGNIKVDSEVYLPEYCTYLFLGFKGNVIGADKFNTSKVINMRGMFSGATSANPDISNWDVSHVNHMREMFKGSGVKALNLTGWKLNQQLKTGNNRMQNMFEGCVNIEYLKTPEGLRTDISGVNNDFKIIRLRKGSSALVEEDSHNLNEKYEINKENDGNAIYHVYKKDKYAGVIFDKNGGDEEGWINHVIVDKGKTIKACNESLPKKNPTKESHNFLGWSGDKNGKVPDFDENTAANDDITVYAVFKRFDFPLNSTENVRAKVGSDGNIIISAVNSTGDRSIELLKWTDMVKYMGDGALNWGNSSFTGNIKIESEVNLPENSLSMFEEFKGDLAGAEKFNVSKVTNMHSMFSSAKLANLNVSSWDTSNVDDLSYMFNKAMSVSPDVSRWNVSNVINMSHMFFHAKEANPDVSKWEPARVTNTDLMFEGSKIKEADLSKWDVSKVIRSDNMFSKCENLEFIKTPEGLKTRVNGTNKNFKVVKMKKGMEAEIEHESINLNSEFNINDSGDKHTAYNIYRKDKYVGVTFDKNDADTSAFRNHEIVEKGKSIKDSKGRLPDVTPVKARHVFLGWAKSKTASVPDFDENTTINGDVTVYPVWKFYYPLNGTGNVQARKESDGNITINVKKSVGDRRIERRNWIDMVSELGGEDLSWGGSSFTGNIQIDSEVNLPEDSSKLFYGFKGNLIGADKFNISKVIDMSLMFADAKLVNPDVSKWNVSDVTNMNAMFSGATSANPNVFNWNVSNVRNMKGMFKGSAVKAVNLSNWKLNQELKTGNDKMQYMFEGCTNLEYLKTSEGLRTDISGMNSDFKIIRLRKGSPALVEEDSRNLNEKYEINKENDGNIIYHVYKKDKYAGVIFDKNDGDEEGWINHEIADKGKTIKSSSGSLPTKNPIKEGNKFLGWIRDKNAIRPDFDENTMINGDITVYSAWQRFDFTLNGAGNVKAKIGTDGNMTISAVDPAGDKNIEREKWIDMVVATGGRNLNWGNSSFTGNIKIDNEVSLPEDSSKLFYGFKGNLIGTDKFNTSKVTNMGSMFEAAPSANPDVSNWDTSNVTNMGRMFMGSVFLGATSANPDVSKWETANVTDMSYMFYRATSANPKVANWNVSKVTNMKSMFSGATSANPDVAKWTVSSVTDMSSMFNGATSANPNVSNWDTANVTKTDVMFGGAKSASPDVSKWNMIKVTDLRHMFAGAILANPDVSNWDTSNVIDMSYMFEGSGIRDADLSKWDIGKVTESDRMFDKCDRLEYVKTPIGLKTRASGVNRNFKVVKLKSGSEATVEHESVNLNSSFTVNGNGDKDTAYNIYCKDTHVGITFDKNGGDTSAFRNHEIAGKGKSIKDSKGSLPEIEPQRIGYRFTGWAKSKTAAVPGYDSGSPVYSDKTVYAVYEDMNEVTKVTIKYTDVGMDEDEVIEDVPVGKPIGSKLDGHERYREGYRFLGYSKMQNADKPNFFKKSIVTDGLVLYPVYRKTVTVDKVKVAFRLNNGTDESLKTEEVNRHESLGDKMPTKDKVAERDGYLFIGWAKSKTAKHPDFFRGTTVKGDMTVYAVWKSLYDEKLGQPELKVSAKAKGYELTITPPKANLHTGFDIFRGETKDFKPSKDNKIAMLDRDELKYHDDKADNVKAYYYAVRAIDADGSYNGTKVIFVGELSDKVLAAPLPKDKGVTATVAGKGAVDLEFNKTIAATKYKVTVTVPYDKKFEAKTYEVEAGKLKALGANKVKSSITGLPMGKFLSFKLEAQEADNTTLVEYGNSFAFMLGAPDKFTAKVNKKRVLNIKFKAMKGVSGYEAKIVINGKVKTIKIKKGKGKLKKFMVGSIKLPKKKNRYVFTFRVFKSIGKLKYYGQTITKTFK